MEAINLITGAALFAGGYLLAYFYAPRRRIKSLDQLETVKKQVSPSFKNPMKPYEVEYRKFKTTDNLYKPHKPTSKVK